MENHTSRSDETALTGRTALIIGCGIVGPATALFLQRAGINATIYEAQTEAADYAGLFLNTAANGVSVLKTLGLEGAVSAQGFPARRMVFANGSLKHLGEVRNGSEGHTGVVIKRGLLTRTIRDEALRQGIPVHFGKKLQEIRIGGAHPVTACFEDGTEATGDFLVGCDGVHSRTRQLIFPHAPQPSYTGMLSCGGMPQDATAPPTPGTMQMIFGKQAFFGYLVKPAGEAYWFSNVAWPGEPDREAFSAITSEEWRQRLLALHRDDAPLISQMIRATTGEIGAYPIYDIPCQPAWHKGPVVLVGDAVHAVSPHAGQGASMALEDAIVLAKCLRDIPDLAQAFARYQALRRGRTEKVVAASRRTGQTKVASTAMARWFRDLLMPVFLRLFANSRSNDWVYSYTVPWDEKISV
jgi:2-polyprenyl-6-methoxyphenol hydroxylase-like FAD-dependent oxidoreductase